MAKDNRVLGNFRLEGIPPAPRGIPQIEVTFDVDANGILHVSAKDTKTNKEQKIKIEGSSNLSEEEINKMKRDAEEHAEEDRKEREKRDKLNEADSMTFNVDKQIKEKGDKMPEEQKKELEALNKEVKDAYAAENMDKINELLPKLNSSLMACMAAVKEEATKNGNPEEQNGDNAQGEAQEVDFEEVKK